MHPSSIDDFCPIHSLEESGQDFLEETLDPTVGEHRPRR